jgi:hypothetical protein
MRPFRALILSSSLAAAPLLGVGDTALLDVPMLETASMPIVDVMVNGQGPFHLGVDTGAHPSIVLDTSVAQRLSLGDGGKAPGLDDDGHMPGARGAHVRSVSVGAFTREDVEVVTMAMPSSAKGRVLDGTLGLGFFGDRLVTFDFPNRRVRVSEGALPAPDGADVLPMRREMGLPTIDLVVGSETIPAHLDTGNMAGAFALPTKLVEKLPQASTPVVIGRARTVFSDMEIRSVRLKGTVRIGRHEFPEPTVVYPNAMEIANVGSKALADFVLTIDAKNARLRLTRRAPVTTASGEPGRTNATMEVSR